MTEDANGWVVVSLSVVSQSGLECTAHTLLEGSCFLLNTESGTDRDAVKFYLLYYFLKNRLYREL